MTASEQLLAAAHVASQEMLHVLQHRQADIGAASGHDGQVPGCRRSIQYKNQRERRLAGVGTSVRARPTAARHVEMAMACNAHESPSYTFTATTQAPHLLSFAGAPLPSIISHTFALGLVWYRDTANFTAPRACS